MPGTPLIDELQIVIEVFKACLFAFNLISDSAYVVKALQSLEVAGPIRPTSKVWALFQSLQQLILARKSKFFPQHIRAHTGLPGPLSEGNALVDALTRQPWIFLSSPIQKAIEFHKLFHVNLKTLQQKFSLS